MSVLLSDPATTRSFPVPTHRPFYWMSRPDVLSYAPSHFDHATCRADFESLSTSWTDLSTSRCLGVALAVLQSKKRFTYPRS